MLVGKKHINVHLMWGEGVCEHNLAYDLMESGRVNQSFLN